jgi:hypothetical protein
MEIAREAMGEGPPRLASLPGLGPPLTDDRAPVEEIADRMYRETRRDAYERELGVLKQ